MIQVTNPALLSAGPDGFAVDLTPLAKKPLLTRDEALVVRLHKVFAAGGDTAGPYAVELSPAETARLGEALETLARARAWPPDVQRMNSDLRARLQSSPPAT
ncbi:MAG TPA: hypothetical protein VGR03_05895 [Candidatus Acidoferrum sp.]|nr:hypothetical protein [Candidatus Acidoferrum sp.]